MSGCIRVDSPFQSWSSERSRMIFGRCGRFFSVARAVKKTASMAMKNGGAPSWAARMGEKNKPPARKKVAVDLSPSWLLVRGGGCGAAACSRDHGWIFRELGIRQQDLSFSLAWSICVRRRHRMGRSILKENDPIGSLDFKKLGASAGIIPPHWGEVGIYVVD